jgi:hypothetical protein
MELHMSHLTIFLGKLIGLYCIIVALGLMANKQRSVETVAALIRNAPLLLFVEVVALIAGLAMVLGHNVWSGGALPVIVTLIGWLVAIRGVEHGPHQNCALRCPQAGASKAQDQHGTGPTGAERDKAARNPECREHIVLGLAILVRRFSRTALIAMLATSLGYVAAAAVAIPHLLVDPLGTAMASGFRM